jgi:hypothetical protein
MKMPINPIPEPTKTEVLKKQYAKSEHWLGKRAPELASFLAGVIIGAVLNGLV